MSSNPSVPPTATDRTTAPPMPGPSGHWAPPRPVVAPAAVRSLPWEPAVPRETPPARPPARRGPGAGRAALVVTAALVVGAAAGATTGAMVARNAGDAPTVAVPAVADDAGTDAPTATPDVVTEPAPAIGGTIDVRAVIEEAGPSVVSITTRSLVRQGPYVLEGSGAGSGVAIEGGYVVTNAHVVEGATAIELSSATSGAVTRGAVVASEPSLDLALVRLEDASGFTPATLGDSATVQVGDPVVAIGNALGLGGSPTVTQGIVSALDRTITTSGGRLTGLLQTDTAISSGNSGGPLLDATGAVIGINTAVAGSGGGVQASNVGFVVPVDTVHAFVDAHLAR